MAFWKSDKNAKKPVRDECDRLPIHLAAADGDAALLAACIDEGQDPNDRDIQGYTPLALAADQVPNLDVLRLLISAGADANAKTKRGESPLLIAVKNPWITVEAVHLLLKNGADPHAQANNGTSPVSYVRRVDSDMLKEAFADLL